MTPSAPASGAVKGLSHVLVLGTDGKIRDGNGNVMPTGSQKKAKAWLVARVGIVRGGYSQMIETAFGRLGVDYNYNGKYQGWTYGDSPQYKNPHLARTDHLKTDSGIGLGATYQQVLAIYPSLARARWTTSEGQIYGTVAGSHLSFGFSGGVNGTDRSVKSVPPRPGAKVVGIFWLLP